MASLRALLLLRRVQHAVLDTIVQGRAGGVRQEGSHGRLAALEVADDAGEGAAGARAHHECVDRSPRLRPYLLPSAGLVHAPIGQVVELVSEDGAFPELRSASARHVDRMLRVGDGSWLHDLERGA